MGHVRNATSPQWWPGSCCANLDIWRPYLTACGLKTRCTQAQAAAARSVALLDRPLQPLEACRAVFLARLPRAAAYDAWWHVRVPAAAAPPLSCDLPDWRCGLTEAFQVRFRLWQDA